MLLSFILAKCPGEQRLSHCYGNPAAHALAINPIRCAQDRVFPVVHVLATVPFSTKPMENA